MKKQNDELKKENEKLKEDNNQMKKDNEEMKEDNKWFRNWVIKLKENDESEQINRLFNKNRRKETISNEDIEAFIEEFDELDEMFDEYFNERQQ